MNDTKVVQDCILVTRDTIFILQQWLNLLEQEQMYGQVKPDEFETMCQKMYEAGMSEWVEAAAGHGLGALRQAVIRERQEIPILNQGKQIEWR